MNIYSDLRAPVMPALPMPDRVQLPHIKYPFEAVCRDDANTSVMTLKCARGHMHDYYISDLSRGNPVCLTCHGTKFTDLVREIVEEYIQGPVTRVHGIVAGSIAEFAAPGLRVVCLRPHSYRSRVADDGAADNCAADGSAAGEVIVAIPKTSSKKKIVATLRAKIPAPSGSAYNSAGPSPRLASTDIYLLEDHTVGVYIYSIDDYFAGNKSNRVSKPRTCAASS